MSRLVGQMLERQMREADSYQEAYEGFKTYRAFGQGECGTAIHSGRTP